ALAAWWCGWCFLRSVSLLPADAALPSAAPASAAPPGLTATVCGWGGGDQVPVTLLRPESLDGLRAALAGRRGGGAIARGMGRSYGDAAQLGGGLVLDTTGLASFELDADRGILTAQAGVTLGRVLAALAPAGWMLPVVPGTQHVTVGGAIASDIHGKNHGAVGTFGAHVLALGLLTSAGDVLELTPRQGGELMAATIGGMGLTGVILWARVSLRRFPSALLSVDTDRFERLDDALATLDAPGGPHRVAWLDLLSRRPVRGVVTRAEQLVGESTEGGARARATVTARIAVPEGWPGGLLRTSVVRAYNEFRFRRTPRRQAGHLEPFGAHMFPLDALEAWPRLYGHPGFVQYQAVLPRGEERALEQLIAALRRSPVPCYLAVLKDFGPESDAPLSFPLAGWTLALDLPRSASGLQALLSGFDERVATAGGRVYLAKDARLRPDALAAMYPRLGDWHAVRDRADPERVWRSDLGLRTGLIEAER
ncbi:MAG: FAD-binding protein, partial [Solirubrobacteraceae bacterium]